MRTWGFSLTLFFFFGFSWAAHAQSCDPVPGEYLVRVSPSALELYSGSDFSKTRLKLRTRSLLRRLGVDEIVFEYSLVPGLLHVRGGGLGSDGLKRLKKSDQVVYVEPNCRRRLRETARTQSVIPNDPRFGEQWALGGEPESPAVHVHAPQAWGVTVGDGSVVVGVVDTGIDFTHEDLADNMWVNPEEIPGNDIDDDCNGYVDDVHGADILRRDGSVGDSYSEWHGTHVAGIIGAVGDNAVGIAGLNWHVKLLAIKIFEGRSGGDTASVIRAWEYAVALKRRGVNIRVLNNSFGEHGASPTFAEIEAVRAGRREGILFVFAAGNEGADNDVEGDTSNIKSDNVLVVAASGTSKRLASFSNFGKESVHIAAPGVSILSTVPGGSYAYDAGTSFSAPFVTGAAALLAQNDPDLAYSEIRERLLATVTAIPAFSGKIAAPGVLNVFSALGVNPSTEGCTPTVGTAALRPADDSDGDGVQDAVELEDGSHPLDSGSFRVRLQSPSYALWNGFLGALPVLELANPGAEPTSVRVSLVLDDGSLGNEMIFDLPSGGERHVVLSELAAFSEKRYGFLRLDFCGGELDGRVSHYYPDLEGALSVACSTEISGPRYGRTFAGFNTFQPSRSPEEWDSPVSNWLTLVNLDVEEMSFSILRRDASGALLGRERLTIKGGGRIDIEAGHVSPGPGQTGLIAVEPEDPDAPYLAELVRYGYGEDSSRKKEGLRYVLPFEMRAGNGETQSVLLSTTINGQNWLEINNTLAEPVNPRVRIFGAEGDEKADLRFALLPYSQVHVDVNAALGDERIGHAEISTDKPSSILVRSIVYLYKQSGALNGVFAFPGQQSLGEHLSGSYNRFFGAYNWLKLVNTSDEPIVTSLIVRRATGKSERMMVLAPKGAVDLGLHEDTIFETTSDTVGTFELQPSKHGSVYAELVRLSPDRMGGFVFATRVREARD